MTANSRCCTAFSASCADVARTSSTPTGSSAASIARRFSLRSSTSSTHGAFPGFTAVLWNEETNAVGRAPVRYQHTYQRRPAGADGRACCSRLPLDTAAGAAISLEDQVQDGEAQQP